MKTISVFANVIILLCIIYVANAGIPSLVWISDAEVSVRNIYLDFDSTITIDGFSEEVRNAFCKTEKYPDCNCGESCNDTMVKRF